MSALLFPFLEVVLRFAFEYALLRDKNVGAFLADPKTYREHRSVVRKKR
jgi:hypothetical protein